MDSKVIEQLAEQLEDREVTAIYNSWNELNEDGRQEKFNTLVETGDTREVAMAKVLLGFKKK